MWDASERFIGILTIGGLFGLFKKKDEATKGAEAVGGRQVIITPATNDNLPPAQAVTPEEPMHPLRRDLRFKGLHLDVDPSASVKRAEMTCVHCDRTFKYFVNSNGVKTVVHCPGCARQYRV